MPKEIKKELKEKHNQEDLWDWICSQVGFDKEGKKIQQAIRLFISQEKAKERKKCLKEYSFDCTEILRKEKEKRVEGIDFYKLGKEYQQFKLQQKTEKDIDIVNAMGWIWDFILFIRKDAQELKRSGKNKELT